MTMIKQLRQEAKQMFYYHIINKLNDTIREYHHNAFIYQFKDAFEISDLITITPDGQINHLLAITVSLVNRVPESPYLEELFNNFLKDYMHLVNPELPFHAGDLYISPDFVPKPTLKLPDLKLALTLV